MLRWPIHLDSLAIGTSFQTGESPRSCAAHRKTVTCVARRAIQTQPKLAYTNATRTLSVSIGLSQSNREARFFTLWPNSLARRKSNSTRSTDVRRVLLWTLPTRRRGDFIYSQRKRVGLPYRLDGVWSASCRPKNAVKGSRGDPVFAVHRAVQTTTGRVECGVKLNTRILDCLVLSPPPPLGALRVHPSCLVMFISVDAACGDIKETGVVAAHQTGINRITGGTSRSRDRTLVADEARI